MIRRILHRTATVLFALIPIAALAAPTLDAPESAPAGSELTVKIAGDANPRDFVTIVPKGKPEGWYNDYAYVEKAGVVKLRTPAVAGDYEIRVLAAASPYPTLARRALRVESASASLDAPEQVAAGADVTVQWKGPNNPGDYIAIGDSTHKYLVYGYTRNGPAVKLRAPDQPGEYELRYILKVGDTVIASRKLTVGKVSASLQGPAEVVGRSTFAVRWEGPNNDHDYINIVPKGAREGEVGEYAYTRKGNPVTLLAPAKAGDYELRYSTGQSNATLASAPLRITPPKQQPGFVSVTAKDALGANDAVEIILDTSGSMLQKIGSQRRIEIAKQTLTKLTSTIVPAGTPFALRVFGRTADSCETELDIPLAPLNPAAASARIAGLEAKNNAKTPIGASLAKVADDLRAVSGERLVILVTDGEETCGGDPAASIEALKKAGSSVRVNIVGFAVDEPAVAATFRRWTDAGGGLYFDARDAAGLGNALALAVKRSFEVLDGEGRVLAAGLVGGDPVAVSPGDHTVRLKGSKAPAQKVTVREKETVRVAF
jgi:hypothetical protein